jgi:hypothetical protein
LPHIFDGKEVINNSDSPNYVRNTAELLSFIFSISAAITVPAVAIWAIRFARQQANEATNSRQEAEYARRCSTYMNIVERWHSDNLLASRKKLLDLVHIYRDNRHDINMAMFNNEQEYICHCLSELKNNKNLMELYSYTILIQFFEDLGLLCYKKYIKQEDIFDFVGSSIETQLGFYGEYIRKVRQNQDGTITESLYANAIYLYKESVKFRLEGSLHKQDMWHLE